MKSVLAAFIDCCEELQKLASESVLPDEASAVVDLHPRLFELPSIAIIVDSNGSIVLMPTLFLADTALASRSVTGDTVRTYAEALLPWLKYVDDSAITLNDVTEETIGVYRAMVAHMKNEGSDSYRLYFLTRCTPRYGAQVAAAGRERCSLWTSCTL